MTNQLVYTPWGWATKNNCTKIAEGIKEYVTSTHGGFWLSQERILAMPIKYMDFKPWAGKGWFEEDLDWVIVVLSFPKYFRPDRVTAAQKQYTNNIGYYTKNGCIQE